MTLQPGCQFAIAPRFHLNADWTQRIQIGPGVKEANGSFMPIPSWREPTAEELSLLVRGSPDPIPNEDLETLVVLFQLPGHILSQWWSLLEKGADTLGKEPLPGFETFLSQVSEFLAFKNLPFHEGSHFEVVVSNPDQEFGPGGLETTRPVGLRCNVAPWIPWPCPKEERRPRLWGGINLGDEATSVVLINLPCQEMNAVLQDQPAPTTVGELAGQFLRSCSDYPTVRLTLRPGEGYRLPWSGLILDHYLADKREPDVVLLISQ